jgi:protein ImuB
MDHWVYLHFNSLQLDSIFIEDNSTPVAVINSKNNEIVQLNSAAIEEGLTLGMGLGSAAALSSNLQVHPYDQSIEKQRLSRIAQWLYLVTADISLFEPDGILLRCSNMLSLYPNMKIFWQTVVSHLNSMNVHYFYASGHSPYAARLLAKKGINTVTDDVNRIKRMLSKPDLTYTDLSNKTIIQLNRVGVRNVGQLLTLSLAEVAKRFDSDLVTYVGRLTGQLHHGVTFYHPPEQFKQYLELLFEISNVQRLEQPLKKVFTLLERFLQLRNKITHNLHIQFHLRDAENTSVVINSAQGEYQADKWLALSQLTLESLNISAPIMAITVEVKRLENSHIERADLFADKKGSISPQELISTLQAKLSKAQVKGIRHIDEHRPELATQYCEPLYKSSFNASAKSAHNLLFRPSFLLPSPQPLIEQVKIQQGPERIVTGWWDNQQVIRDYFIARSAYGRWLWIYRTPEQKWFIHGFFS